MKSRSAHAAGLVWCDILPFNSTLLGHDSGVSLERFGLKDGEDVMPLACLSEV